MKILVGLVGLKESGKDTSGEILAQFMLAGYGLKPVRLAFADALKEEVAAATGGSIEAINRNKHLPEVRKLLQWWGTELRREQYDKEYWLKKLDEKYLKAPDNSFVYVTDVRFLNESQLIKQLHGIIIKVQRSSLKQVDSHSSEIEQENIVCHYILSNHGTLENLHDECRITAQLIAKKHQL